MIATTRIKTSSGLDFDVRLASADDQPRLIEFWKHVSPLDLARRAIGIGEAGSAPPAGGADTTEYLAFDGDHVLIAVALLVTDRGDEAARTTVCTDARATHHGVSWALLDHVLRDARAAGIRTVESLFSKQDVHAALLERKMGFVEVDHAGDGDMTLLRWTFAGPVSTAGTLPVANLPVDPEMDGGL